MRKVLALIITLFIAAPAFAGGNIIRDNDTVAVKIDCLAFSLAELSAKLPQGTTAFETLVFIFSMSLRDLTPAEQALCDGLPPPVAPTPGWHVHDNSPTNPLINDRPGYTLEQGVLVKHKTERVDVGEACGDMAPQGQNKSLQYRYVFPRADKPTRPKWLIGICVETK